MIGCLEKFFIYFVKTFIHSCEIINPALI
jgi:hypothetical protein